MPRPLDVRVDWDGDGDFTGTGEDVSARVLERAPVTASRGRDQIRALAPPMAGTFNAELLNTSKDYSPEYASSPLYGNLLPGRLVQLEAGDGTTRYLYEESLPYDSAVTYNSGTGHVLWTGILDDLPQHPELNRLSVTLPSFGTLSRLRKRQVDEGISTALYSNILTSVALGHLLDAAGWPAADRVIDTGKTTLLWWWLDNADPFTAMVELLATEGPGAAIYEDGRGRIVFESRHYRLLTARSTTSQATLRGSGSEPLFSAPFSYNPGLKDVINRCTITVKARSAKSLAVVWSLGENVALAANETKTYVARQTSGEPFTAAVAPVAATDYTVQSGSVTSITLNRTSGASVTITITGGAGGASVTGLQLRAQPVTVDSSGQATNTIDTSVSQTRYGRRTYPLPTRAEVSLSTAQDFCNAVVGIYQAPRPQVSLALNNGTAARLAQALGREISDRVTIVEAQTAVNHDYFVEQIAHRFVEYSHVTTLGLEKAVTTNYGIWGSGLWGSAVWGF